MSYLDPIYSWLNNAHPESEFRPSEMLAIIGDVHGRSDLLEKLLPELDPAAHLVFVGDLIDRGEYSADVLRQVYRMSFANPGGMTCLMGNHERMLLDFLDRPDTAGPRWLRNGGLQTLASFGVGGLSESSSGQNLNRAAKQLHASLGSDLLGWVRQFPLLWTSGNVTIVHAAADPSESIDAQKETFLLWGHHDFPSKKRKDGQWIVHGHTVVETAAKRHSTVAVDTGAYFTGRLSAALIYTDGNLKFQST